MMDDSNHENANPSFSQASSTDEPKPAARNVDGDDLVIGDEARAETSVSVAEPAVYQAEVADAALQQKPSPRLSRPRRKLLPLNLFILTCFSTFLAGATQWNPLQFLIESFSGTGGLMPLRTAAVMHWQEGLTYTGCVLLILFTHEMGHFLATLRYRIPASFPFFIPLPISPIGTMGAVIGMDGMKANRREMFDIGIAGPLAGLVVAIPITWIGISQLDLSTPVSGPYYYDSPIAMRMIMDVIQPIGYQSGQLPAHSQLNPFFMAGWVGLLITGLNMIPVGQLDGGHITYALFGKKAHWIARAFMAIAVIAMIVGAASPGLALMAILVLFVIGTDHPPTSDDTARLGVGRTVLGFLSLSIPILCFAPKLLIPITFPPEIRVPAEQADQDQTASDKRPPSGSLVSRLAAPGQEDPYGNEDWFEQNESRSFVAGDSFQAASEQPIGQAHLQHAEGT